MQAKKAEDRQRLRKYRTPLGGRPSVRGGLRGETWFQFTPILQVRGGPMYGEFVFQVEHQLSVRQNHLVRGHQTDLRERFDV